MSATAPPGEAGRMAYVQDRDRLEAEEAAAKAAAAAAEAAKKSKSKARPITPVVVGFTS